MMNSYVNDAMRLADFYVSYLDTLLAGPGTPESHERIRAAEENYLIEIKALDRLAMSDPSLSAYEKGSLHDMITEIIHNPRNAEKSLRDLTARA